MVRKTRTLPFLPTCGSPTKTLSFRASTVASTAVSSNFDDMFATGDDVDASVESVFRGLKTDRFFFNPGKTSSILDESKPKEKEKEKEKESVNLPFKESVSMMEMESTNPFVDFKKSMQEMIEADEGLKQWDNLQELLSLYLAVNDKLNHGYIIRAFVDLLLVNLGPPSKPSSSSSCSSSTINGQKLMESSSSNNNNKMMMMSSDESPEESGLSFTSSFASSSGICSSTSHFLSSCSLEDDEDEDEEDDDGGENNGDDEDHNSNQKASVSDHPSSCLKV